MKPKQLAILLVLAAVLGGATLLLRKGDTSAASTSSTTEKVLAFPLNDVAQIALKSPAGELHLNRKADEWTVQERADYPADFELISTLLRKLWELKPGQEVKAGPSQYARLELVEPGKGTGAGALVALSDKDGKPLASLLVGKKYLRQSEEAPPGMPAMPAGRYILAGGKNAKISLVPEAFDELEPKAERWLKRSFFQAENPRSYAVTASTPGRTWTLVRDGVTSEWKFAGAGPEEKADATKLGILASLLANANFVDVMAPDAKPADTGLDAPTIATVETFDDFTYVLKIGKLTGDNYPVTVAVSANIIKERTAGAEEKPEDKKKFDDEFAARVKRLEEKLATEKKYESRAYLMAKSALEPLLKDRAAMLIEKKPEAPPPVLPSVLPQAPSAAPAAPAPSPAASAPATATTPAPPAVPAKPAATPAPKKK